MRPEQLRVKQLLTEAVKQLCSSSLQFKEDVTVQGLLGFTLDKSDIFLVSIHETIQQSFRGDAVTLHGEKRNVGDTISLDGHSPKKRRRRRRSREGSSSPPSSPANQTDPGCEDPRTETPDHVNVKSEKSGNDSECSEHLDDGRRFNPAHDSTATDNKTFVTKQPGFPVATSTPAHLGGDTDLEQVRVKQEVMEDEEEDCLPEESDCDDNTDSAHTIPPTNRSSLESQSWEPPGGDQSGFHISELDMISAGNFQQQFASAMGGANNLGNISWGPRQLQDQGQPSTSGSQEAGQRFPMPRPPKSYNSQASVSSNHEGHTSAHLSSDESSSDESLDTPRKKKQSRRGLPDAPVLELPMSFLRSVEMAASLQATMNSPGLTSLTDLASSKDKSGMDSCPPHDSQQATESLDGDIIRKLVDLKEIAEWMNNVLNNVADTTHKIQYLLEMSDRRPAKTCEGFFPQLEKLPLKTLDELKALEMELEGNQELQTVLTNALAVVGGDNLQKTARNVMDLAMTNNLQRECNWEGKQSWKTHARKFAFGGTQLATIMTQAVHANESLKSTTSQIHNALKIYLRNAADRCGGRRERQKLKEQDHTADMSDSQSQSQGSASDLSFTTSFSRFDESQTPLQKKSEYEECRELQAPLQTKSEYEECRESQAPLQKKNKFEQCREDLPKIPVMDLPASVLSSMEIAAHLAVGMHASASKSSRASGELLRAASTETPSAASHGSTEASVVDIMKMLTSLHQLCEGMNIALSNVAETAHRIQYLLEMSEKRPLRMCEGSYPQLGKLPLDTVEELKMLELDLGANPELQAALTQALAQAGGDTLQKTARNVMNLALTNSLQRECNWEGKLSWKSQARKFAFGGTKLANIMTQSIISNDLLKVTTSQIQNALKIYLRNAADRGGGRRHRQKIKEQMQNVSRDQHQFGVSSNQSQFDVSSDQSQFDIASQNPFDVSNNENQFDVSNNLNQLPV